MTAKIYHADLYGIRKHKYQTLLETTRQTTDWQELSPNAPFYLFVPQEQLHREQYDTWHKINDVFPVNSVGITTGQDAKAIAFTSAEAENLAQVYALPSLPANTYASSLVKAMLYRSFDTRYIVYSPSVVGRLRQDVMRHMLAGRNVGFCTNRQVNGQFSHTLCSRISIGDCALSAATRERTYLFPLWLYPTEQEAAMGIEKQPNIAPAFLKTVQDAIGHHPTPEDIFHYAYAIFHAPTYRTRYAPFLKTDFPRLPLPPNNDAFQTLADLGAQLVALHLLEAPQLAQHGIGFPVAGPHTVLKMKDALRYVPPTADSKKGRVKLNATEYFDNVPPEAWDFQVGGYRPAAKWLADREGRNLTEDDIDHYRRTLAALRETDALLPSVDTAFTDAFPLTAATS